MKNKIILKCDKKYTGVTYQSEWFDFYLQYFTQWHVILFKNQISGLCLRKTILQNQDWIYLDGYGIFADVTLLGFRFGIYITLISFKKKH